MMEAKEKIGGKDRSMSNVLHCLTLIFSLVWGVEADGSADHAQQRNLKTRQEPRVFAEFLRNVKNRLTASISMDADRSGPRDSIAIAFFDSLDRWSDTFYDLYHGDSAMKSLQAGDTASTILDGDIESIGFEIRNSHGIRTFRPSPRFVLEKFASDLSEGGKTFFELMAADSYQPRQNDEWLSFQPTDSLIKYAVAWNHFGEAYKGSYLGRRGDEMLRRYLEAYLKPYGKFHFRSKEYVDSAKAEHLEKTIAGVASGPLKKTLHELLEFDNSKCLDLKIPAIEVREWDRNSSKFLQLLGEQPYCEINYEDEGSSHVLSLDFLPIPVFDDYKRKWVAMSNRGGKWRLDSIFLKKLPAYGSYDIYSDSVYELPSKKSGITSILCYQGLKVGRIKGIDPKRISELNKASLPINLNFSGTKYTVFSYEKKFPSDGNNDDPNKYHYLFLEKNGRSHLVALTLPGYRGPSGNLDNEPFQEYIEWIGDLNRDGGLDLITVGKDTEGCPYLRLYLSNSSISNDFIEYVHFEGSKACGC